MVLVGISYLVLIALIDLKKLYSLQQQNNFRLGLSMYFINPFNTYHFVLKLLLVSCIILRCYFDHFIFIKSL